MITGLVVSATRISISVDTAGNGKGVQSFAVARDAKYVSGEFPFKPAKRDDIKPGTKVALHGVPKGSEVHTIRIL